MEEESRISCWLSAIFEMPQRQDAKVEMDIRVRRLHVSAGSSACRPVFASQVPAEGEAMPGQGEGGLQGGRAVRLIRDQPLTLQGPERVVLRRSLAAPSGGEN